MSNSKWTPPQVFQGDPVLWYDGPNTNSKPYTAIVTAVAREGLISVLVFPESSHNGFPKSTVRHADDPNKQAINSATDGVWTHTERTLAMAPKPTK